MAKKRVVVTGLGIVSCFGSDVGAFYQALLEGRSGIRPITAFPCEDFPTRFAGEVAECSGEGYLDKKQARRVDPFIRYAVVAGKKAMEDASLEGHALEALDKTRCGVVIGSGMGGMSVFYEGVKTSLTKGFKRITPFFVPYIITNMGGAILSIDLGFEGPNYSISTACATGNHSIIASARHIQNGEADLMICGGVEAPITPPGLGGFVVIKALSERNDEPTKASRPWDKTRDGFVMGEGAGTLVLESLDHAVKRGAKIYGEYLGGYVNADAYHMTTPREDGSGVALCMQRALEDAGVAKEEVNYVNAHATSTPVGDLCEIRGIKTVFGPLVDNLKVNATKSLIGHCLGAAGGIEAIATLKAIETGKLHPTLNVSQPEEELGDIDIVKDHAQKYTPRVAISNSFGFGGHNATLVLGPYRE